MLAGSRCVWVSPGTEKLVPREDCLRCACSGRNPCGYPLPVIQQVLTDRDPNVVQCSATMIAGCARESGLKKNEVWWISPEEAYTRAHGSLLHLGAETKVGTQAGVATESRIKHPITLRDGREVTVTAQVDIVHADGPGTARWSEVVLVDYKTVASLAPSKLRVKIAHHVAQLSIQRWLLIKKMGWYPSVVQLIFMTHDDRKVVPYHIPDGPSGDEENEEFPEAVLMTLEETEEYLQHHLPALVDSLAGHLAPPLPKEEGWKCRRCDVRDLCERAYGAPLPGLGGSYAFNPRRNPISRTT